MHCVREVAGVTFSDSYTVPLPKFLNPDQKIFENPNPVQFSETIDETVSQQYSSPFLLSPHRDRTIFGLDLISRWTY